MSAADADSIRSYARAVADFLAFTASCAASGTEIWNQSYQVEIAKRLLQAIKNQRRDALLAGVHAGETYMRMSNGLDSCIKLCERHQVWEREHGVGGAHELLAKPIKQYLARLEDLESLALSQKNRGETEEIGEIKGLNQTDLAVLKIIRAQPNGQGVGGKEIISQLKKRRIDLSPRTLVRWTIPKLKKSHGVINHKAAGGYLIP